jgi:hypothetical protein
MIIFTTIVLIAIFVVVVVFFFSSQGNKFVVSFIAVVLSKANKHAHAWHIGIGAIYTKRMCENN